MPASGTCRWCGTEHKSRIIIGDRFRYCRAHQGAARRFAIVVDGAANDMSDLQVLGKRTFNRNGRDYWASTKAKAASTLRDSATSMFCSRSHRGGSSVIIDH